MMNTIRDILLPAASAIMIACITMSLVAAGYAFGVARQVDYLVLLSALVALESYFSVRIDAGFRMRLVELAILYAVLEAADTLSNGGGVRQALVPHASVAITIGAVLLLFVWLGVREMADMLPEIHRSLEPTVVVGALTLRFVAGGVLLFAVAGLSQHRVARDLHVATAAPSGPLLNVLIYFLIGILVLSYLQYESTQQRWEIQQVHMVGDVQAAWLRLTAALLVLALVLAVLLPTTQVFGLTAVIGAVGKALAGIGLGIWGHMPGHSSAPPLGKIFGHGHHPPPPHAPVTGHGHGASPPSWLAGARTAIFWAVIVGGIIFMLFRVRWSAMGAPRQRKAGPSFRVRLARWWRRLWRRARRTAGAVAGLVPRSLPRRSGSTAGPLRRFLRLNALAPEEQVRYFYLSLIRRAEAQGVVRSASQTPREFAAGLSPRVGDAGPDLEALTDAFVEARYSGRPMGRDRVNRIKAHWRRVRSALRPGLRG
jgi:hypothetical protein